MRKMKYLLICGIALTTLFVAANVQASPVDEAKAMVDQGQRLLAQSKTKKGEERTKKLVHSATKFARAYALILARNLKNDAPDLFKLIQKRIDELVKLPELQAERGKTKTMALKASSEGRLTDAYDLFARLRDLDPRDQTIEYILGVIGQRMETK
jgi:hypothetical protein